MNGDWIPVSRIDGGDPYKWIRPELVLSVDAGCQCLFKFRDGDLIADGAKPYRMDEAEFRRRLGIVGDGFARRRA